MKAIQKNKQSEQHQVTPKAPKKEKPSGSKKTQDLDLINSMVYSEYDVWPILAELHNHRN